MAMKFCDLQSNNVLMIYKAFSLKEWTKKNDSIDFILTAKFDQALNTKKNSEGTQQKSS